MMVYVEKKVIILKIIFGYYSLFKKKKIKLKFEVFRYLKVLGFFLEKGF